MGPLHTQISYIDLHNFSSNGWDDEDGYHLDKYDDVEDLPFELDNTNLKGYGLKAVDWGGRFGRIRQ